MARTRTMVECKFSAYIGTVKYEFSQSYHPDFKFSRRYSLYWNTGNGYTYTDCINAYGNFPFNNNSNDVYIGSGKPSDTTNISLPIKADDLVGTPVGFVYGDSRTQSSNYSTIGYGESFTEYTSKIVIASPKFGQVEVASSVISTETTKELNLVFIAKSMQRPSKTEDGAYLLYTTSSTKQITATPAESCIFLGWYNKDGSLVGSELNYTLSIKNEETVEARFSFNYTIRFNANGGSGTMSDQSFQFGVSKNLSKNTFTRQGYVFAGWSTTPDGDVEFVDEQDGSKIPEDIVSNVTLYAVWVRTNIVINNIDGKCTLQLFSVSDNKVVATGTLTNQSGLLPGSLCYQGEKGKKYRVDAEPSSILYAVKGVYVDGEYIPSHQFTLGDDPINRDFYGQDKTLYSVTVQVATGNGTANVTSPSSPHKDGKYVEGTDITITATPNTGYELTSADVRNADNTNEIVVTYTDNQISNNKFTIDKEYLNKNLLVRCSLTGIKYSVKASIDDNSKKGIDRVIVSQRGSTVSEAAYDSEVIFTAVVKTGYKFAGWYKKDGTRLSTSVEYTHTVKGAIELVAKAKVEINLGINYDDNTKVKSCKVKVNGTNQNNNPYIFDVILGESFSYDLVLGTTISGGTKYWIFNGWYDVNGTLVNANRSGSIRPDKAISMVAKVMANLPTRTLTINFKNNDDNSDLYVSDDILSVNVTTKSKTVVGSVMTLEYEGDKTVTLTFAQNHSSGAFTLDFLIAQFSDGTESNNRKFTYTLSKNTSATVIYGQTGERTTQIDFTDNCDRTFGVITIDGNSSESASGFPMSVVKEFNADVEIKAEPKSGYRFVGWYNDKAGKEAAYSIEPTINLKVVINRTLYAKFLQDASRVYVWEGGEENKNMIWRSKTYEATKPFNPSACRVDTTGYPVNSLSVEMFSSPYSSPTTQARLTNLNSQESRRLPIRRMERFLQVEIRNDKEVDAIYIGTSMGGLAV